MFSIKFIFIGNGKSLKKIWDWNCTLEINEKFKSEAILIFNAHCNNFLNSKYKQKNKIVGNDENYYFIIYPNNIFYLLVANKYCNERRIFELLEEINKQILPLIVNNNEIFKVEFQSIIQKFENYNKSQLLDLNEGLINIKIEECQTKKEHPITYLRTNSKEFECNTDSIDNNHAKLKIGKTQKGKRNLRKIIWIVVIIFLMVSLLIIMITTSLQYETNKNKESPPKRNSKKFLRY